VVVVNMQSKTCGMLS